MPERRGMFGARRSYDPDIIDLDRYHEQLLGALSRRGTPMPPPPIPGLSDGEWTVAEMDAMRRNRREADVIYRQVKDAARRKI